MPLISFDNPWKHQDTPCKHQKTRGFLMFSGGIKRDQWHEMGSRLKAVSHLVNKPRFR